MKTFAVKVKNPAPGTPLTMECEQLATFAEYVLGVRFRFVVLRIGDGVDGVISLTERDSTARVCELPRLTLPSDYVGAGRRAISALIEKHGADRVRAVLASSGAP